MGIQFWKCCGKNYVGGISTCRVCKRPKPEYGILEEGQVPRQKTNDIKSRPQPNLSERKETKPRKPKNHLIGTEERLFVSTLKMKGEK